MSIGSLNELQQLKWPYGATAQLVNGVTTSTTYTYPSSLAAGYYAFSGVSLNDKAAFLVASSASNGLTLRIKSKELEYFQLTTTASDFTFESEGAVPTADTNLIGRVPLSTGGVRTVAWDGGTKYVIGTSNTTVYDAYVSTGGVIGAYQPVYTGIGAANTSTYANGKFVIGGDGVTGGITSSTDAITWSYNIALRGSIWQKIRYINGKWIAVGRRGSIATSTDAISWDFKSGIQPGTGTVWSSTVGPSFVLTGTQNNYVTLSTTGVGWGLVYNMGNVVRSVLYANSLYVAAGNSGLLSTSTDAITWTARTSTFGTTAIYEVRYDASTYVAVGVTGQLRTSTDAITWTARTSGFGSTNINSVGYGNGKWVAVGDTGFASTSTDAITWSTATTIATQNLQRVKYLNNLWIAVGTSANMRTSTDAVTWTARTANFGTSIIYDVTYYNGYYVIAGAGGTVRYSTDAVTWSTVTWTDAAPTTILYTMFEKNGRLHATGASGYVYSSTDGVSWQQYYNSILGASTGGFYGIAYNGTTYVAAADVATANALSTDGVTWTRNTSAVGLQDLVYDNTKFVGSNASGQIYTSTDGVTWPAGTALLNISVNGLLYSDNQYIVYGVGTSNLQTSTDAVTWTSRTYNPTTANIYEFIRGDGTKYVAADNTNLSPTYSSSTSASSWRLTGVGTTAAAGAVNNNSFIVAGGDQVMVSSVTNPTVWTLNTSVTTATTVYAAAASPTTFALATDSNLLFSTDGQSWSSPYANSYNDVVYDSFGGVYIAADAVNAEVFAYMTTTGTANTTTLSGFTGTAAIINRCDARNGFYAFGASNGEVAIGQGYTNSSTYVYSKLSTSDINGVAIGDDVIVALTQTGQIFYLPISEALKYTQLTASLTATSGTSSTTWINQSWSAATLPYTVPYTVSGSTQNGQSLKYNNGVFVALMTNGAMFSSTDGANWSTMNIGQPTDMGTYSRLATYGTGQFFINLLGAVMYTSGGSLPSAFSLYQVNLPTL